MTKLVRGMPVIISEADAPSTLMVAVLLYVDGNMGSWRGRYLDAGNGCRACFSPNPTPLSDFGMTVELDVENGEYRVVPTTGVSTATYSDGKSRRWQDERALGVWHKAKAMPFEVIKEWLAREIAKVAA